MSGNQADSQTLEAKLNDLQAKYDKMEGKMKGLAGQIGGIRSKVGVPRPGTPSDKPESGQIEAIASQPEPVQAPKAHSTYSWMKGCPGCGGADNTDYKAPPTHWCNKCGVPLGRVEKPEELQAISKCWNCQASGKIAHSSAPVEVVFK